MTKPLQPYTKMTNSKPQKYCQIILPGPFESAFDYCEPVGEPALSLLMENSPPDCFLITRSPCASQAMGLAQGGHCHGEVPSAGTNEKLEPVGEPAIGSIALVPFGRRMVAGIVVGFNQPEIDIKKIKPIAKISPLPPLTSGMVDFIKWMAAYCLQPVGMIADMALLDTEAPFGIELNHYRLGEAKPSSPAEKRVASVLADKTLSGAELITSAKVAVRTIDKATASGFIIIDYNSKPTKQIPVIPAEASIQPVNAILSITLSPSQQTAADELIAAVTAEKYQPFLLDGITGSGKTEVYFAAIEAALKNGKQSLILLPEIALTIPWQERFEKHFGFSPLVWHSNLGEAKRRRNWQMAVSGEAKVIVGARSSLLLPLPEIGLIIVDEEHDASYKQEEQVLYNARDMAVARAKHEELPIVLASATPSLETVENAAAGRYRHLKLTSRHGGAELPETTLIDMRTQKLPATRWLSAQLLDEISRRAARGEQSLLFLNRRGYAPLTLCRNCGHRFQCDNCSAWLVLHIYDRPLCAPPAAHNGAGLKAEARHTVALQTQTSGNKAILKCHHCGKVHPVPPTCPVCQAEESFAACGPGVQRIADEVAEMLPNIRQGIIASDNINTPAQAADFFARVESGEIQLLIGTQMIAKGHHFPKLSMVGVVDADLGLNGGDPRAAERTFQLLHQVTGRAGREDIAGHAFIQTYQPEHPVMQAIKACDRDSFHKLERDIRISAGLPPFGRLAAIIMSGDDEASVRNFAGHVARSAPYIKGVSVLGPSPAPMYKLKGDYRLRFLLKSSKDILLQPIIRQWLMGLTIPRGINLRADIDPQSFI